jgi:hypothetical protein
VIKNKTGFEMPMFFELPARVDRCQAVLGDNRKNKTGIYEKGLREQAARTAWKIISDWVDIQVSMVLLEQADVMQIFLPYAYDVANEKTFYDHLQETNFKAMLDKPAV